MNSAVKRKKAWGIIMGFSIIIGILGAAADIFNVFGFAKKDDFRKENLQLTLIVTDLQGNAILENEGELNIPLGNRVLHAEIGENGRTQFPDITTNNLGDSIMVGLNAPGWEIYGANSFIFDGHRVLIRVRRDNSLGRIKGIVKSRDGQELIPDSFVSINADTLIYSNLNGKFNVLLPEEYRVSDEDDLYSLTVGKNGYKTITTFYSPASKFIEVRLEKI